MLSRWRMQEQHSKELGLSQIQYVFLELPKYGAGTNPQTLVDKWAYFFREAKNLDVVPPALSEAPFRDALEVARTATFQPEEWEAYRETLILRLVEGMTGPEIAERTGLTPDSVRVNLSRGMKLLRGQLSGEKEV